MKSIKDQNLAKQKDWNIGKTLIETRLPCYLKGGFYIPDFTKMSLETINLQRQLHVNE